MWVRVVTYKEVATGSYEVKRLTCQLAGLAGVEKPQRH